MRYFFAIVSLLVAVVLLVLGVGQRTFLAGPKVIEEVLETSSISERFLVLPASVFSAQTGNPSVVLTGEDLFVAYAEQRDVAGWLEPLDHLTAEADAEGAITFIKTAGAAETASAFEDSEDQEDQEDSETTDTSVASEEAAGEAVFFDPRGSDLWLSEHTGDTSLTVSIALESSQAVIVTAGVDEQTLPSEVKLMWAQPRETPLAGPLLLAGGTFAVLGAVLYLLAIDHDRRGIGPRRGRRGPFQGLRNKKVRVKQTLSSDKTKPRKGTKAGFTVALAAAGALTLSSCVSSYWPQQLEEVSQPSTSEEVEAPVAVVPVSDAQLDNIIDRIVSLVIEADLELDPSELQLRLEGAALQQREANYKIRKEESDWRALPFLTSERLGYDLVQSTEKWPRTLFVTLSSIGDIDIDAEQSDEPEQDSNEDEDQLADAEGTEAPETADNEPEDLTPSLALIIKQESPHENYKINRIVELRGGIEMPEAAPLSEGTAVLADDIQTLQLTPFEAAESLATVMQSGVEAEEAGFFEFDAESLIEKMGGAWAETQCVEDLECSATVSVEEESVVTLSTGQSGALVAATINDNHEMKVKNERSIVKLSKVERALGLDGSFASVTRNWKHQVLMYVPGKDSDKKITILGSSSELVSATGDKATIDID
ncbi:MAG TPA: hypothetical protein VLZ31_01790 [Microbacteriaceae bacterium]|nr:hypothetical protein [Microbacteriaceae bacterium]